MKIDKHHLEWKTMKYDDASWHYGGNFPKNLPIEAGATHTGMFLTWALLSGLGGVLHTKEFPENIDRLKSRSVTPGAFFIDACDGKFTDEDLNDEGNAFTQAYFDFQTGKYLADYEETVGENSQQLYYVKDSWENFDLLKSVLNNRLTAWRKAKRGRFGWLVSWIP
jgi:hypothetical protein